MRLMLLAAAALAATGLSSITIAHPSGSSFSSGPRFAAPALPGEFCRADGRRHHHGGGFDCVIGGGFAYVDSGWAVTNNRSWDSDSYNDWWNDRPDRAFPRWMSRNQDCARQWYSGDTLRC